MPKSAARPARSRNRSRTVRPRDAQATRRRILLAALSEFSRRGLPDARIDDIAAQSGANKRMIYYYFGSKERLYLAALESVYAELARLESRIDVDHLDPVTAVETLINMKIDYYIDNPHFVSFLGMENLYHARHLRRSRRLHEFATPMTEILARILARGERMGVFRTGIDPVDLYISICGLCIIYFSNQHTLGVVFGRRLETPAALKRRKKVIADMVTRYMQGDVSGLAKPRARREAVGLVPLPL
jgi:TetR/AcrR family transcriptional regulator